MNRRIKKLISVVTALSMCIAMIGIVPVMAADSAFSGGSGTQSAPYLISTAADLTQLGADVDGGNDYTGKYFEVTQDITLSGYWNSIGEVSGKTAVNSFAGIFDGKGYTIDGLSKDGDSEDFRGIFAANKGTIKNLIVAVKARPQISDQDSEFMVGGITAYNEGIIEQCGVAVNIIPQSVNNTAYIGGIVGYNKGGTIENCYNDITGYINFGGSEGYVGAIVGYADADSTITKCYNKSSIVTTVAGYVGGIAGESLSKISYCYNTGSISSGSSANKGIGAITGGSGDVESCYNIGKLTYINVNGIQMSSYGLGGNNKNSFYLDNYSSLYGSNRPQEQFYSGEITYLLNGKNTDNNVVWRQDLSETNSMPSLDSSQPIVYHSLATGYTNTYVNPEAFSGGSGTQGDPLLISSEEDLKQLKYNLEQGNTYAGKYVKLTQDIAFSEETSEETDGFSKGFAPIGLNFYYGEVKERAFAGTFDGDGHKISNFNYENTYTSHLGIGLFAYNNGTIKNLSVDGNIVVYADDTEVNVGGIVGYNYGTVKNCHFSGSIGYNLNPNCIAPSGNSVGGVVGVNVGGCIIDSCSNTADINVDFVAGSLNVGGVLGGTEGKNYGLTKPDVLSEVYNSYNTGTITVGGSVTDANDGTVYNLDIANVGGIIGWAANAINCFNAGEIKVTADTPHAGQIIGYDSDIINCFYWYGTKYKVYALSEDGSVAEVSDNGAIAKTAEQFESGEVTYLLNNSSSTGYLAWHQTLGENGDIIPTLDSSHGVVAYDTGSGTYSNIDPDTVTTNRNIYVDFMGVGDSPGEGKKSGNLDSTNKEDTFWVGVAVDKVNDLNLFTDGIYSLELAFEYNPDFVRPDIKDSSGSTTGTELEKDDRWNEKIANANIGSETGKIWNSDYTSFAVYDSEIDQNADRADKDLLTERQNWKMCTVSITLTEQDMQNLSFKGLSSPDKQYLLKLPFTLVGVPEDGAADPNPIVLSLIRGPETFDIGSGSNGETPNAKWNETENQGAANNLKTHFNFAGDVRLFGESVSIEDITPFRMVPKLDSDGNPMKDANDKVIEEEETYELSYDNTLAQEGFEPSVDTYYLSISNDPNNLQLRIKTDSQPYIYVNGSSTAVTTTSVTGGFVTAAIPLNELDVGTKDQDNGFNNIITIKDDPSSTNALYTIHVRRLLKPKIELNYGNSPYGMIMKESTWDDAKKKQAKTSFNSTNRFNSTYLPSGASTKLYSPKAWSNSTDSELNLDRNDYSIFIYNKKAFKDPGFKAVDSMGDTIQDEKITRSIVVDRMPTNNYNGMKDDNVIKETIEITDKTSQYTITELTAGKSIRPGIYNMSYSFTDTKTGETVTNIRKVVLLWTLGDADLSTIRNAADASATTSYVKGVSRPLTGVNSVTGNLYLYRIIDADKSGIINAADASTITSIVKGVAKPEEYYQNLN